MIDADLYRSVLGRFASGVTVLTARDADGTDHGMTASAFCSLSLDPPLVLVCVNHETSILGVLRGAEWFGISVLAAQQETVSRQFAENEPVGFDGVGVTRAASGVLLIDGALAHIECRVADRYHGAGSDHTVFVGAVERAVTHDGRPLLYYRGGYAQLER